MVEEKDIGLSAEERELCNKMTKLLVEEATIRKDTKRVYGKKVILTITEIQLKSKGHIEMAVKSINGQTSIKMRIQSTRIIMRMNLMLNDSSCI